jgi:8-oxo-dGTP pyrophosphatase MutT (NUDIX family)
MSETGYVAGLRAKVGHDLLLMPGVAAVIRDEQGRILVQQTKQGNWNLPAGAIDPGEKAAQAIIREVFEETGLTVRPTRLIGLVGAGTEHRITYDNGDLLESVTVVFLCEHVSGELEPQDDETIQLKFFPPSEMPELPVPFPAQFFEDPQLSGFFEWDESWLIRP